MIPGPCKVQLVTQDISGCGTMANELAKVDCNPRVHIPGIVQGGGVLGEVTRLASPRSESSPSPES